MKDSIAALTELLATNLSSLIDNSLPLPNPYIGSGDIRLIIIGQDPTVQRIQSRKHITVSLNLNHKRGLWQYLNKICGDLGLSLEENVYATNACKNFFNDPPTKILKQVGVDVLAASAEVWLPVLRHELAEFPDATIISLGEPVLTTLVRDGHPREVKYYWGYHRRWKQGMRTPIQRVEARQSTVGRSFHPFIHQPSYHSPRATFYRQTWPEYIDFVRTSHDSHVSIKL